MGSEIGIRDRAKESGEHRGSETGGMAAHEAGGEGTNHPDIVNKGSVRIGVRIPKAMRLGRRLEVIRPPLKRPKPPTENMSDSNTPLTMPTNR